MTTKNSENLPQYQDEWLRNEYVRLEQEQRESLKDIDEIYTIDPEFEIEEMKDQINKKFEVEKKSVLILALRNNPNLPMSFQEIKQNVINQIANCIWINPHLNIEFGLAELVTLQTLSEGEAKKILDFQKHKQEDNKHKILLIPNEIRYSGFFIEAKECLKQSWFKQRRIARDELAAKSKLLLWLKETIESFKWDWNQIKGFLTYWISSFIVGAIVYGLIEYRLGMPDMTEVFLVASTVITVMWFSAEHKKKILQNMKSSSDFERRLLIERESADFQALNAIIIVFLIVFALYVLRGCPDSIPIPNLDSTNPA